MAWFHRSARLPDAVRGRLPLGPGERVVAAAPVTAGWAVAGTSALHVVPEAGEPVSGPWCEVDSARLDPEDRTLAVAWVDGTTTVLELADPEDFRFPREVHARVQSSVVHSERVEVGLEVVRVALRRGPDGALFTQVLGSGVDLTAPATAARIAAAEARVRDAAGLR